MLSEKDIRSEIAANATETFLTDADLIESVVNENKSLAQKIIDTIKSMIDDLKDALSGYRNPKSTEAQAIRNGIGTFEKALELWINAAENQTNLDEKSSSDTKYSLNNKKDIYNLVEKIENRDNSIDYRHHYSIGTMPEIYHEVLGVAPLNLVIAPNHVYYNLVSQEDADNQNVNYTDKNHFHELGSRKFTKLVMKLNDPIAIYNNFDMEDKPRILVKLTDKWVASIELYANANTADGSSRNNHATITFMPITIKNYMDRYNNKLLYLKEDLNQSEVANAKVHGDLKESDLLDSNIAEFKQQVKEYLENRKKGNKQNFSLKEKSNKQLEADYNAAVKAGNEEIAKKIVEQYAYNKGFTEKVYHGTQQFGFTKMDVSKSDDNLSVFTTSTNNMASSYILKIHIFMNQ